MTQTKGRSGSDLDPITARWRRGSSVGRTVYAVTPGLSDTDVLIGMFDTPELARAAVDAHNDTFRTTVPPAADDSRLSRVIASINLGVPDYQWHVLSYSGVVKVLSSRDGYMIACAPETARRLGVDFAQALDEAADSVDRATRGGQR